MKKWLFLSLLMAAGTLGAGEVQDILKKNNDPALRYTQKLENYHTARAAAGKDSELLKLCWLNRFSFTNERIFHTAVQEMLADPLLKEEHRAGIFAELFRSYGFAGDPAAALQSFRERLNSAAAGPAKVRYAVLIAVIYDEMYRINGEPTKHDCLEMVKVLESARTPETAQDPELLWYLAKAHMKLGNLNSVNDSLRIVKVNCPPGISPGEVFELSGDLLRAQRLYAEAYQEYAKANPPGCKEVRISARWKQAECAMIEQQFAHALVALEGIDEKRLDENDRRLLQEQIKNLRKRLKK